MNIAVLLSRLGHTAVPFAFVGENFSREYTEHLAQIGIDRSGLMVSKNSMVSSHALIITDASKNQFTAFFPGPSKDTSYLTELRRFVAERDRKFDFVVIAPDIARNVLGIQEICDEIGLDSICDPGQCITDYTPDEMRRIASAAQTLCLNRYEYRILTEQGSWKHQSDQRVIVTDGKNGIKFNESSTWHCVPAAVPNRIVDPTGCGDAFRSGLVHASMRDAPLLEAVRSGATLAAMNLEQLGIQDYPTDAFVERYATHWNSRPEWLEHE